MKGSNFRGIPFYSLSNQENHVCFLNCAVAVVLFQHSDFFSPHLLHYFVGSRIFVCYKTEINSL